MVRKANGGIDYNGQEDAGAASDGSRVIETGQRDGRSRGHSPWIAFLINRRAAHEKAGGRRAILAGGTASGHQQAEIYWQTHSLLFTAFAFAAGILIYSLLPAEPESVVLALVFAAVAGPALSSMRTQGAAKSLLLVLAVLAGLCLAAFRTSAVEAPRLAGPMTALVRGEVLSVDVRRSGKRILVKVSAVNGLAMENVAFVERVRLRVPPDTSASTGDWIEVRARLFPPMGPVVPGGYDFAFRAYFQKIGATGFSYGLPAHVDGPPPELVTRLKRHIDRLRHDLALRISANMSEGPESALAVALLVGDRSGISEQMEDSLRAAGLAHILAISGLHMALFAGGAYAVCLGGLALIPGLALRWPLHKVSAFLALGAAVYYLLLSGASVATQRSFIMITLVFMGLLFGRRGLTLRSVAIAGLVLLVLAPERLFYPGFQMSFAAVIALVAVYDVWRTWERQRGFGRVERHGGPGLAKTVVKWLAGLFVTALVAGIATGIVGAYHFSRIAPFGIVGNMLGMPVFSVLVMPMGVLALALMPFGLGAVPLKVMSFGLSLIMDVAQFTEQLAPSSGLIGTLSAPAAGLLMAGVFLGLLTYGRWRMVACIPLIAGLSLAILSRPPDIYITSNGTQMAARNLNGDLQIFPARGSFAAELWLEREGVDVSAIKSRKMKLSQRSCDPEGCVIRAYAPLGAAGTEQRPVFIAYPKTSDALVADCKAADMVVSDKFALEACKAPLVLGRTVRKERGAVSIWLARKDAGATAAEQTGLQKLKIGTVAYAVKSPPRPWHELGTVTWKGVRKTK